MFEPLSRSQTMYLFNRVGLYTKYHFKANSWLVNIYHFHCLCKHWPPVQPVFAYTNLGHSSL